MNLSPFLMVIALALSALSAFAQTASLPHDFIDQITLKRSGGGAMKAIITRDNSGFTADFSSGYGNPPSKKVAIHDASLVSQLDSLFQGQLKIASLISTCLDCMRGTWVSLEMIPGSRSIPHRLLGITDPAKIEAIKLSQKFTVHSPITSLNTDTPDFFRELETYLVDFEKR